MGELNNLKKLLAILQEIGKDKFTFVQYYDAKTDRGNLCYLAEINKIDLKDTKIINYLLYGDYLPGLTKTMEEKRPKLGLISSYEEVVSALEFVIKNYSKLN